MGRQYKEEFEYTCDRENSIDKVLDIWEEWLMLTDREQENFKLALFAFNNKNTEVNKEMLSIYKSNSKYGAHRKKKIMCINDGKIFDSLNQCARYYKVSHVTVSNLINGKTKNLQSGLKFKVVTNDKESR